jgi:hypothetical protein
MTADCYIFSLHDVTRHSCLSEPLEQLRGKYVLRSATVYISAVAAAKAIWFVRQVEWPKNSGHMYAFIVCI